MGGYVVYVNFCASAETPTNSVEHIQTQYDQYNIHIGGLHSFESLDQ